MLTGVAIRHLEFKHMRLPGLQFVYAEALLTFRGPVQTQHWELISDLTRAKSRAWEGVTDDDRQNWGDLRENVAMSCGIGWPPGLSEAVYALAFAFTPWWVEELVDDIHADLGNCVAYQFHRQREARLFPMLLEAYAAGGWPCGWSGEYPDGNLCVFWQDQPVLSREPASAHERRVAYQKRRCRERIKGVAGAGA
jgi:hypothetical protein